MSKVRVRTAFDADPIRREPRIGALRALLGRADRFLFDPSPRGESIWRAIAWTIFIILLGDIIFAALRGRGSL